MKVSRPDFRGRVCSPFCTFGGGLLLSRSAARGAAAPREETSAPLLDQPAPVLHWQALLPTVEAHRRVRGLNLVTTAGRRGAVSGATGSDP